MLNSLSQFGGYINNKFFKKVFQVRSVLLLLASMLIFFVGFAIHSHLSTNKTVQSEQYTLVPDKISESAAIPILLPEGSWVSNFDPAVSLHFSPEIKGRWLQNNAKAETETKIYRYLPDEKLAVGKHYLATLDTQAVRLEKMFSVDKDPTVLAVFPKQESEVNEYSHITVMFSRPMVALSTLSEMADISVPVVVTPPTPGRWKWVTTRTLEFIPETRLMRSSHYTISVSDGFVSEDGVKVANFSHSFTTRTLGYQNQFPIPTAQELAHDQPLRIYFDQPIDLEKTRSLLTLTSTAGIMPFVLSYGTRATYDEPSGKQRTLTDRSLLEIYPEKDSHGRKFLWDFDTYISLSLKGAVPAEGDITLTSPLSQSFHVHKVIESVTARSEKSSQVAPSYFDPSGTLVLSTGEPIDLAASNIVGKAVVNVLYDEKCKEPNPGEEVDTSNCPKVPDHSTLLVTFDASKFTLGETSKLVIKKLVNTSGVTLLPNSIEESFTTYPKFEILSTLPQQGEKGASMTHLSICSTGVILQPEENDFYKKIHANMMLGKWNWQGSYLVVTTPLGGEKSCPIGTYQTSIQYGLVPKFDYHLSITLDDPFGQHSSKTLDFTTEDADPLAKGFTHLQPIVLMTPPDRTKLSYGLDFMDAVDMTVCKVSALTMLRYRVSMPSITTSAGGLECSEKHSKHITLPSSYATRKYFQIDLHEFYKDPTGNFVVVFSNPEYRRIQSTNWNNGGKPSYVFGDQLFEKTFLTVTHIAVGAKQAERNDYNYGNSQVTDTETQAEFMRGKWPTNLYWVNDALSAAPLSGASVTAYAMRGQGANATLIALPAKNTDAEGITLMPSADNIVGAIVEYRNKEEGSNVSESAVISTQSDALSYVSGVNADRPEYVYTDRPIYRPGDTVHIKGIARIGYDGNYETVKASTTVDIRDSRYATLRSQEVGMSKYGTFEMSFILDSKAPLGYYQIGTKAGGSGSFQVEEYVAPQFKVAIAADKEEYISGDTAKFTLDANYYFGVPVAGADVEYKIVSQEYYFDRYSDEYFNFGAAWYDRENGWYGDHYITGGKLKTNKDGKAVLSQELSIDKLFSVSTRSSSKLLTIRITVKNENGQSVSSEHSFILHRGTFYAGLTIEQNFFVKGQEGTVKIKTVDTKGAPIAVSGLDIELDRVEWKSYKRQEVDGNYYYRSERSLTKVSKDKLATDAHGNGSYKFVAGDAGEYEFVLSGQDERGNTVSATYDIYVAGSGNAEIKPTNNASLELTSDKTTLTVGETAHFIIKSPYPNAKALVTIVRGDIYERKVFNLTSQLTEYSFPITERYIPNISAQVLLLAPGPEVKYGDISFSVGTKQKELTIDVVSNKKQYLPGEDVTLNIHITDSEGKPVRGETSIAVVDMSVLALVGNPKKNPVALFYGGQPVVIRTLSNVKNVLTVAEIPTGTKGGSGGGGDDLEKKKRGVFRDTALWVGAVESDANGRAVVHFTLPDNLTEWQVESVGITKDTKLGASYVSLTSRKTIMAVPLKPRFILPGDTFSVGGTVFNESEVKQTLDVSISSPTLRLTGNSAARVTIEPHTSLSVSFPALAPSSIEEGQHSFTFSAKNAQFQDEVNSSFPIERNDTYEHTASAGRVTDATWKERLFLPKNVVPDRGGLTISVSATMASILNDAIRGMILYPYECSEQVASKLRTIALVKKSDTLFGTTTPILFSPYMTNGKSYTTDEIVALGLAKLYQNEGADGGVAFYANTPEDFWLTRATLETYLDLKDAGYVVDKEKMASAARYVFNWVSYPRPGYIPSADDTIASAYILSRMNDRALSETLAPKIAAYAANKELVSKLSTPALSYLAILATKQHLGLFATNRIFSEFENRSVIDARGTIVKSAVSSGYSYITDELADTALALKAFSESERESPLLEGYLRSIKKSKTKSGGWESTYSSITVIDAVTQYLAWKKEGSAHEELSVDISGKPLLREVFDKKNITDTFATSVPMTSLTPGVSQSINFTKKDLGKQSDAYYYDLSLKYYLPADKIPPRDEGFAVERALYRQDDTKFQHPVTNAVQGEVLHGRVTIKTGVTRYRVGLEDFIPAGVEIVNQGLATEDHSLVMGENTSNDASSLGLASPAKHASWPTRVIASIFSFGSGGAGPLTSTDGTVQDDDYGGVRTYIAKLYPTSVENHDDRIFAYISELAPGEYVYEYYVRALVPGVYQHLPLVVSELYTPENFGRSGGEIFTVTKKE